MNATRLRQARRLFNNPLAPDDTVRHNIRAWVRSLRHLGDKWLFAKPINMQRPQQS